ncbi:MAG: ectoine/hydroxyectoine ABC transporter permease subunit EhuD [Candidatus Nitrohelix vancouverensis]|uniref:Ectoine/hydroxyectoine ABC transporter permease subunit EhuD n=1 Tax=Candidatus Nitrohelix vancouverensis TaxID=2705534 RepID=A0A7T0G2M4_9BACT|nr:MAG: ectoine/hydroxyectoine ABC transporter permease subunit EhuD [Candidatus Nitrohelix vancouverensis]
MNDRIFDWSYAWSLLPELGGALWITVLATVLGMIAALALGLVWAVLRKSKNRAVYWSTTTVVEFIRSTPLLVQIYFLFYVLPETGFRLNAFQTGVLALGLHYSAYLAEVYRAGIDSVQEGQWEAAKALNMSKAHTFRSIILPQALPPIIPAVGNYVIAMLKDTPMLSAITVLELLQTAKLIGSETFRYIEPLTLVGLLFLMLSLLASRMTRYLERRYAQ